MDLGDTIALRCQMRLPGISPEWWVRGTRRECKPSINAGPVGLRELQKTSPIMKEGNTLAIA